MRRRCSTDRLLKSKRKMKHTAVKNRQKALSARGGKSPEKNPNLQIFIPNQSRSVSLPLVSDSKKLVWVHSNQIDLPPKSVVELRKVFDKFPYLTQRETKALAQHCSLHPDQVKVWFMVQRIRYGISWDFKDIQAVRSKLNSNQGMEELQKRRKKEGKADGGKKRTRKRIVSVSGGKNVEDECKKEESTNKQPVVKEKNGKGEEDKKPGETGEERKTQRDEEVERVQEEEGQISVQLTGTERERELHAMSLNPDYTVTDVDKLKELIVGTNNPLTDSKRIRLRPSNPVKTKAQVLMMRRAFLHCQYPDHDDYNRLSTLIGLPRSQLVQWYSDTRYHIKKGHPRWLSKEQHSCMLANIKYRQFLRSVMKKKPAKSDRKIEWDKTLNGSLSCGKTQSVQPPPEAQSSACTF